ncbi:hypothetical protein VTI74DRAFT_10223 [Chaetomium olivicolor]
MESNKVLHCLPRTAAALRKQLKDAQFLKPDYANNSKVNVADRVTAADYSNICQTCRFGSWGTSWEYFRQYKQLYASVTGSYVDRNDSREIQKGTGSFSLGATWQACIRLALP